MKAILLILLLAVFMPKAHAETHEELVHFTAHTGMGFATELLSDQVYNKFLGIDSNTSIWLSFGTALLAGSLYKLVETQSTSHMGDAVIYNSLGATMGVGTVLVFDLNWIP